MKSKSVTIQMKAIEQYFPVVLFSVAYYATFIEAGLSNFSQRCQGAASTVSNTT